MLEEVSNRPILLLAAIVPKIVSKPYAYPSYENVAKNEEGLEFGGVLADRALD